MARLTLVCIHTISGFANPAYRPERSEGISCDNNAFEHYFRYHNQDRSEVDVETSLGLPANIHVREAVEAETLLSRIARRC